MRKTLKYQETIDSQNLTIDCPNGCEEKNVNAFRWVFDDINHEENFLPNVLKGLPPRKNEPSEKTICMSCGLSFFGSMNAAKTHFRAMAPKAKKNLGYTHIAEGKLNKDDGVASEKDKKEHFTFYEYVDANLHENFTITGEL